MSQVAIEVRGLSKAYPIFERPEHRLLQMLVRGRRRYFREFWALKGLDLTIFRGETVGIVGTNGSGKSTLLQLICGSLTPTSGQIAVNGTVAALLELGTGFNPEFTGRENVFMNSAILGRSEAETERRLKEIEAFADIGEFIERPVKTYSSGMYARLAFSVAIHVDPDILVVDEALAVGDAAFARKCFARIESIKERGGTILFVSHNASQVLELCDRAVLLHHGEHLYTGDARMAIGYYQKLAFAPPDKAAQVLESIRGGGDLEQQSQRPGEPSAPGSGQAEQTAAPAGDTSAPPPGQAAPAPLPRAYFDPGLIPQSTVAYAVNGARIIAPRIEDVSGERVNALLPRGYYRMVYEVVFERPCLGVRFYTLVRSTTGVELGGGTHPSRKSDPGGFEAGERVRVCFDFQCLLGTGVYFMNCGVGESGGASLHRIIDALMFRVDPGEDDFSFGTIDFLYQARLEPAPADAASPGLVRSPVSS